MDEASKRNFTTLISFLKEQRELNDKQEQRIANLEQQLIDLNSQFSVLRGMVMSQMKIGPTG